MKFSAALSLAIAPVALAKAVHNVYPVRRDSHQSKESKRQVAIALPQGMAGVGITPNAATEVIIIWQNPGNGAATTTINQEVTVTQTVTDQAGATPPPASAIATPPPSGTVNNPAAPAAPVGAAGATHSVTVGGPAGLQYTPPEIQANVGDMVIFTYLGDNHTTTQSAFDTPCDPLAGGMDSGFQTNKNNSLNPPPQVAMQVMVSTPLWFYCKQNNHCGQGMTFSVNPTTDKTQALFQQNAIVQKGQGKGSAITGNAPADAPGAAAPAAPVGAVPAMGGGVAAAPAAGANTGGAVVPGTGTIAADGSCVCAVTCGAGAFPATQAQGVGAMGGFPGSIPANMLEM